MDNRLDGLISRRVVDDTTSLSEEHLAPSGHHLPDRQDRELYLHVREGHLKVLAIDDCINNGLSLIAKLMAARGRRSFATLLSSSLSDLVDIRWEVNCGVCCIYDTAAIYEGQARIVFQRYELRQFAQGAQELL